MSRVCTLILAIILLPRSSFTSPSSLIFLFTWVVQIIDHIYDGKGFAVCLFFSFLVSFFLYHENSQLKRGVQTFYSHCKVLHKMFAFDCFAEDIYFTWMDKKKNGGDRNASPGVHKKIAIAPLKKCEIFHLTCMTSFMAGVTNKDHMNSPQPCCKKMEQSNFLGTSYKLPFENVHKGEIDRN